MQLHDYALGQMEYKTNLGYVKRGCGTSMFNTLFPPVGKGKALIITLDTIYLLELSSKLCLCGLFPQSS